MDVAGAYITQRQHEQFVQMLYLLIEDGRRRGLNQIPIRDSSGAQIAVLTLHMLPKRPEDMPRALRPKQKLSKRQRDSAKHKRLRKAVAA